MESLEFDEEEIQEILESLNWGMSPDEHVPEINTSAEMAFTGEWEVPNQYRIAPPE